MTRYFCPVCMGDMKPLFTGHFCPNDCDRPRPKAAAPTPQGDYAAQYEALLKISRKVLSQDRQDFIDQARGRSAPWFALQHRGTWRAVGRYKSADAYQATIILRVREDGGIDVLKNRDGANHIDSIPDQP